MKPYLSDDSARRAICEYGRRIYDRGYVAANDGNITVRVSGDSVWATPTGVSKGYMNPDMMIKMDLQGNILSKSEHKPSSEIKMHLRVYQENDRVQAVVHAHPPCATAFSIAGNSMMPDILVEPVYVIGEIPCAKFAKPGTFEVPDSIAPFCRTHDVALLANHGALTWAEDIETACFRMESLEHFCKINMYSRYILKDYTTIPEQYAQSLIKKRKEVFHKE